MYTYQCPICGVVGAMGTSGRCLAKNLSLALKGNDPDTYTVINCGACGAESNEFNDYDDIKVELNKIRLDIGL